MSESKKWPVAASAAWIVLVCVVVDVALHRLFGWAFAFNYFDNGLPPSVLVSHGVFPVAAVLGFGLMFGYLAWRYTLARAELGGSPSWAGQRFFAPMALIVFFGVLESAFVFPTPFTAEFITGVADAVPYFLFGFLLSRFVRPASGAGEGPVGRLAPWPSLLWVALVYVAGRYLVSYPILHIVSGYTERAAGTFAWTVACGLSFGAFYWLAGSALSVATPLRLALRVGGLTLGVFWLMFQLFYALMFAVSVSDLVIRGAADTVYLVVGIYSFERWFRRGERA